MRIPPRQLCGKTLSTPAPIVGKIAATRATIDTDTLVWKTNLD